jgi:indole-3-glycerol phosphate synthase
MLREIVEKRVERLAETKKAVSIECLEERARQAPAALDFKGAFASGTIRIIAEVKRASPSKGVLNADLEPSVLVRSYETGGAAAISVLTEQDHFQGSLSDLEAVRSATRLPILRKDFIVDPYQVVEARASGADSFLLIASILDVGELQLLLEQGRQQGMEPLVEVHDRSDLDKALNAHAQVIGINNRDLKTFQVSLDTTVRLAKEIPDGHVIISESGIRTREDILSLRDAGVHGFLIGETLVTSQNPAASLRELVDGNA